METTILVVEAEPAIRELVQGALQRAGFGVRAASNTSSADTVIAGGAALAGLGALFGHPAASALCGLPLLGGWHGVPLHRLADWLRNGKRGTRPSARGPRREIMEVDSEPGRRSTYCCLFGAARVHTQLARTRVPQD